MKLADVIIQKQRNRKTLVIFSEHKRNKNVSENIVKMIAFNRIDERNEQNSQKRKEIGCHVAQNRL